MKLNPAQVSAHLSRTLAPVYVVAGDEPLLIQETQDQIRAAARQRGYSEREVLDVDRSFDWSRVSQACGSLSLFASLRIVELRMPNGAPGTEGAAVLQKLAEQPPQDVLFLVVCGPLETKQRNSAWFAALEGAGASVYAWPIASGEFAGWLDERIRAAGLIADADALQLLAERTEGNTLAAAQDIAKLSLLFPGRTIGVDQVREAVADSARFDAFDLTERMLAGDASGVVRSLSHLREEGVEVLELLGALTYGLRQWANVQTAFASSGDVQRACEAAYVPRPRQAPYHKALRRTRLPQIYGWMRKTALIDQLAKSTGGKEQAWEELLTLLMAAAGAAPRLTTTGSSQRA